MCQKFCMEQSSSKTPSHRSISSSVSTLPAPRTPGVSAHEPAPESALMSPGSAVHERQGARGWCRTEVEEAVAAEEVELLLRGRAVEVDVVGICRGARRR